MEVGMDRLKMKLYPVAFALAAVIAATGGHWGGR
jgi:hypothetical protein